MSENNDTNVFQITGCHDCPFYSDDYCGLGVWLQQQDRVPRHNHRVNEWRAETMPASCPLKERPITAFERKPV